MAYEAEISRNNPSMFLFLIDQSGSMDEKFAGEGSRRKDQAVADAINKLLQNLVIKCAKSDGVRDYYHVGVIGYGTKVGSAFGGDLANQPLVPISKIADSPVEIEERTRKVEDGAGGLVDQKVRFPIWFKPLAFGGTPMVEAFTQARKIVDDWMRTHPAGFPPIIINITDGESSDGDPLSAATALRGLRNADGDALLFNVHLSSLGGMTFEFPHSEAELPDKFAKQLFQMSSPLPPHLMDIAQKEGYNVREGARGFVFNADIVAVIKFLDIGTRPSNLR
jgi:hypothetical protein